MNIKEYFLFALFLLTSLSNASAMDKSDLQELPKGQTHQQELPKGQTHLQELPKGQAPVKAVQSVKETVISTTAKPTTPVVKKIKPLSDIVAPLNDTLGSARIYVNIKVAAMEKDPFFAQLTSDQKIIHGALPRKTKTPQDYLITASNHDQTLLYRLFVTSLQDANRVTNVVMWKCDGMQEEKRSLRNDSSANSSFFSILETLRQEDVSLLCSNEFGDKSPLMKEFGVSFISTQLIQKPTRIYQIDDHKAGQQQGPKKTVPELVNLNAL